LQKGYKSYKSIKSGTSTLKQELEQLRNYADVPFMLKYHRKLGPITFYGNAGPSFSYAMSGKQSTTESSQNGTVTTTGTQKHLVLISKNISRFLAREADFFIRLLLTHK
jgi:hypothetical protein